MIASLRAATLAALTIVASACAQPAPSADVDATRAVAVGAFFAAHEAFALPPGEHIRLVSEASPELIATMRARIRTVLARYYTEPLYSHLVAVLDGNYTNCPGGACAPFSGGFGMTSVEWGSGQVHDDITVVAGRIYGWVANVGDGARSIDVGEWFRYDMTRTPAGWRVSGSEQGFLPGYEP